jgi:hypothetical protein
MSVDEHCGTADGRQRLADRERRGRAVEVLTVRE